MVDPGAASSGGNAVVAKDPLVHAHHKDRPRYSRLDNPECTLGGSRLPRWPLDLVCDIHTYDIECSHRRHGPQY